MMENNSYIHKLTRQLSQLSDSERADVIDFYSEYIMDANLTTEDEIVQKLGTPKQLARKILADYSIRAIDAEDQKTSNHKSEPRSKRNIRMIWLVILALMASPIAIPLLLALIAVLFAFMVAIAGVIIGTIVGVIAIAVAGIACIIGGLLISPTSIATCVFFIGIGLSAIGIMLVVAPLGYLIIKVLLEMAANFTRWLYQRFSKPRQQPKED